MQHQSMHLRCRATSSLRFSVIKRSLRTHTPAAVAHPAMAAIEGPKEVTDVLTDLNNKYEAVRAFSW